MSKILMFLLVFSFVGAIGAAVPADAVLSDFPRLAGETDDAPRFRRAISAAANGVLAVGKGEYAIATPIVVTNRCSIEMHPAAHLYAVAEMDFILAKGLPEMLEKSVCFDCRGGASVFDGCYADTGVIGFNVPNGAILTNCGSYNNPRMGLREMTAIVHDRGSLSVSGCAFSGPTGKEKLYRGCWKNVVWQSSTASGGDGMGSDAQRLRRLSAEGSAAKN